MILIHHVLFPIVRLGAVVVNTLGPASLWNQTSNFSSSGIQINVPNKLRSNYVLMANNSYLTSRRGLEYSPLYMNILERTGSFASDVIQEFFEER